MAGKYLVGVGKQGNHTLTHPIHLPLRLALRLALGSKPHTL